MRAFTMFGIFAKVDAAPNALSATCSKKIAENALQRSMMPWRRFAHDYLMNEQNAGQHARKLYKRIISDLMRREQLIREHWKLYTVFRKNQLLIEYLLIIEERMWNYARWTAMYLWITWHQGLHDLNNWKTNIFVLRAIGVRILFAAL